MLGVTFIVRSGVAVVERGLLLFFLSCFSFPFSVSFICSRYVGFCSLFKRSLQFEVVGGAVVVAIAIAIAPSFWLSVAVEPSWCSSSCWKWNKKREEKLRKVRYMGFSCWDQRGVSVGYSHLPSILVVLNQLNIKDYKLLNNMYIGNSCKILKREKVKKEEGSEEGSGALSFFLVCLLVKKHRNTSWWCGSGGGVWWQGKIFRGLSGGTKKIKWNERDS